MSRTPWSIRRKYSRARNPRWAAKTSPICCRTFPAPISGSGTKVRCRCSIPAMCLMTRSCPAAPACLPALLKPASRQVPMHKPKQEEEAVTSLHDLSAVDLIAGYKAKQFSPAEVLEDLLAHVAAWEPHLKALYAFDP